MKLYGGIDLRSNSSVVALLDEEEQLVYRKRLANDAAGIVEALAALPRRPRGSGGGIDLQLWHWLAAILNASEKRSHLSRTRHRIEFPV